MSGPGLVFGKNKLADKLLGHTSPEIHIDVSHSRQHFVKGERLVRYELNTVIEHSLRAKSIA